MQNWWYAYKLRSDKLITLRHVFFFNLHVYKCRLPIYKNFTFCKTQKLEECHALCHIEFIRTIIRIFVLYLRIQIRAYTWTSPIVDEGYSMQLRTTLIEYSAQYFLIIRIIVRYMFYIRLMIFVFYILTSFLILKISFNYWINFKHVI